LSEKLYKATEGEINYESNVYKSLFLKLTLHRQPDYCGPTLFYFKIQYLNFDRKNYNHNSSQSQKHSSMTSQTQISVIQSQNQQQPIVPIQQLFQNSS